MCTDRTLQRARRFTLAAICLVSPIVSAGPVQAQTSAPGPAEVVRSRNEEVKQVLLAVGEPVDEATRERLKDVINGLLDFEELSRRALGRHWSDRTEQEQQDFVHVFRQLIRNSSVKKLGAYRADSVHYERPDIESGTATLTTTAFKNGKSVEVVYLMHLVSGQWRAYDIVVDGSSTVRTYRDSFNRQIRKTSYGEMYQKLADKLEADGA